jgi:hypothetical protein
MQLSRRNRSSHRPTRNLLALYKIRNPELLPNRNDQIRTTTCDPLFSKRSCRMGWRRIGEGFEYWVGGKLAEPVLGCHGGDDAIEVEE